MKAKLINNQLDYFKQPDFILGDATAYAVEQGYKDVIHREGDKGIWEDDTYIYVETPAYVVTNEDIRQRRQDAYRMRSDSLYMAFQKYLYMNLPDMAEQAKQAWLDEINKINLENPYIL